MTLNDVSCGVQDFTETSLFHSGSKVAKTVMSVAFKAKICPQNAAKYTIT